MKQVLWPLKLAHDAEKLTFEKTFQKEREKKLISQNGQKSNLSTFINLNLMLFKQKTQNLHYIGLIIS